jgi:hypothetical protein
MGNGQGPRGRPGRILRRTDISAFVSQEVIDGCVARGVFELPPAADVSYLGFVDPSGGASDAMTLAIAHRLGDMASVANIEIISVC